MRTYNNLFFSQAFDDVKNHVVLSNEFVMYLTARIIINNSELIVDLDKLYEVIALYYPSGSMKRKPYKDEVIKRFSMGSNLNKITQPIRYSENIQAMISRTIAEGQQNINDKLISLLMNKTVNDETLCCILAINAIKTGNTIDYYGYLFLNMFNNFAERIVEVEEAIASINDSNTEVPISCFITNTMLVDVLFKIGCTTVDDLKNISSETLVRLSILDYENFLKSLSLMRVSLKDYLKESINKAISDLNVRDKEVLLYRNGFDDKIIHTLEETGTKYGVTRERVRQIEARANDKLARGFINAESYIRYIFMQLSQEKGYATVKEFKEYFDDENLARLFIIAISIITTLNIEYDSQYQILIDIEGTTYEEIKRIQLCDLDDIITIKEYSELSDLQRAVVDENYNIKKGVYLKKGINSTALLDAVIRDVLPDGYHNGDINDFTKVINEGRDRYGEEFDYSTEHALMSSLERAGYILIDRGTYKHKDLCLRLPPELLSKIIEYIVKNMPIVFYTSIYEEFYFELEKIGINNRYYLKGVLDVELPEGMHTKRDYISGEKGLTSHDAILQKMNSFEDVFTLNDLRNTFPSVEDYVFTVILHENKKFIKLSKSNYVRYDLIGMEETDIFKLKETIDKALSLSSAHFVTDRKVFSRLKLFSKDLLLKIKYIENNFDLFSLINYLFSDNYYLKRPFISKDENASCSYETILSDYVGQMNEFTSKTIKDYCDKHNMRGMSSYLEFMEAMSDEYVQVSKDKMVKKSLLGLSDEILEEISRVIETTINYSGKIDTRLFKGYEMFPKIKFPWSKYLLVGIIRTYMNQYSIEYTGGTIIYDFVITKNEG